MSSPSGFQSIGKALPPFDAFNNKMDKWAQTPRNSCLTYLGMRVGMIGALASNLLSAVISVALMILTSPLLCHQKTAEIPKYFAERFKDSLKLSGVSLWMLTPCSCP